MNRKHSICFSKIKAFFLFLALIATTVTSAHEIRPALLNLIEREAGVFDVTWKVPSLGDQVLGIRPILPNSLEPVGPSRVNKLPGTIVEYATYTLKGESLGGEKIYIDGLSTVQIDVLVQIQWFDGSSNSILLQPKSPEFIIPAAGSPATISVSYLIMGIEHILSGIDHLLFVLALMLLVPNKWKLFKTITAFTLAHSITLALATLGVVNIPPAPTEAIISLSIVFLCVEIIYSHEGKYSITEQYPWIVAMIFGLFHGLGFAGALSSVGLPANEIPLALLMFNVGVEIGQIAFLFVVLLLIAAIGKLNIPWPKNAWKVIPYGIGSLASFWTIERITSFL